jgi:anti-sigma regulatory factor (Ser/Thr protein kinase)
VAAATHCLLASPVVVGRVRGIVAALDELADYPDVRFAAQLLASELASNCVLHAGLGDAQSFAFWLECDQETLRVAVTDGGPGLNPLALLAKRDSSERHHGLSLLDALADRWGFRHQARRFCIWFEVDLVPGRRPWRGREPTPNHHQRSQDTFDGLRPSTTSKSDVQVR